MTQADQTYRLEDLCKGSQLPALPQSAIRMLELSQNPDNGPNDFAVPIEADPGLTGQVLRFVNSSYFGFSREISSVRLAINLVGIRTIKNFTLWSAVFSLMPNPKCGPFDLKALWQDSLCRGLFARALGHLMKSEDADDLFAAGLLQDMAVPLLAKALPDQYLEMFDECSNSHVRLSQLEQKKFGWDHAEAAAVMAREWSLPEKFASFIKDHTRSPDTWAEANLSAANLCVAFSALLPTTQSQTWNEADLFLSQYEAYKQPSWPSASDLFKQVDEEFKEFAPVLRLSAPCKSLQETLEEAMATS